MPGFQWSKIKTEMLGQDDRDWHAYIEVRSPAISESHEVVSLGDRYLLSLGAHATHCTLLMDKNAPEPLTVASCLLCCAILTFATDSPVVPVFHTTKLSANDTRSFAKTLGGTAFRTVDEYGEKLSDLVEAANVYTQTGFSAPHSIVRTLVRSSSKPDCWIYYPWPPTEAISRSLAAYWMASLSILSPSRILNFWRAIEAVTSSSEQGTLFEHLHLGRLSPVWTEATRIPVMKYCPRRLDACRLLRKVAMRRRDELIAKYRSAKAALKFVYEEGRGKAAHADRKSLEYDMVAFTGDQLRDAELLRYMAREAIERAWNVHCPTLEDKGRLITPADDDVPALMDWYETQFRQLINNHAPSKIAYRLTLDAKKKQLFTSIFPLGILNLLSDKEGIPVVSHTSRAFVASRLGLPKHADIYDKCDEQFGSNPPYWDENQKNAVLVAWFELDQ